MTTRYITTNSGSFNEGTGDTTYEAQGVVISGGIDMRYKSDDTTFNGGGNQTIYINGGLLGSLDDYWGTTSGNDRIFVGSTGYIDYYWFGAINLGGGGHSIVNQGTISTSTYANAILINGSVGTDTTSRDSIANSGVISGAEGVIGRTGDAVVSAGATAGVDLTNSGSILAGSGAIGVNIGQGSGNYSTVANSGLVTGGVDVSGGHIWATNTGTIEGADNFSGANAYFVNAGALILTTGTNVNGLTISGANSYLSNNGQIYDSVNDSSGAVDAIKTGDQAAFRVYNDGLIWVGGATNANTDAIALGAGAGDMIYNDKAGVIYGNVGMGSGAGDYVANGGLIVGTVALGSAASDLYYGTNGKLSGTVVCGSGGDVVYTGSDSENVTGGLGNDYIVAGTGGGLTLREGVANQAANGWDTVSNFQAYSAVSGAGTFLHLDAGMASTTTFTAYNGGTLVTMSLGGGHHAYVDVLGVGVAAVHAQTHFS
jgi:hypothetical protein